MERHIDANKIKYNKLSVCEGHGLNFEYTVAYKHEVDAIPAADVVPKSEVDRLETEVRLLTENSISAKYPCCVSTSKGLILTKSLEEYDKLLADIASEVAREIFEEIENWFELYSEREYSFAEEEASKGHLTESEAHDYALDIIKDLRQLCVAELKKKYTGEKDNES